MEWLTQNWIWVLVGAAFIALHMFGHGGHGGHGNGDDGKTGRHTDDGDPPTSHRH